MVSSRPEPEPALEQDLPRVVALLEAAGLPTAGVAAKFPSAYAVVRAGTELVAAAGLESYGSVGLLRSVVVAEEWRGRGLGASPGGRLRPVVHYFRRLHFHDAARSQVPVELRAAPEFASICPVSAVCLKRDIAALPGSEPRAT